MITRPRGDQSNKVLKKLITGTDSARNSSHSAENNPVNGCQLSITSPSGLQENKVLKKSSSGNARAWMPCHKPLKNSLSGAQAWVASPTTELQSPEKNPVSAPQAPARACNGLQPNRLLKVAKATCAACCRLFQIPLKKPDIGSQ